jgi:hypothetical protein
MSKTRILTVAALLGLGAAVHAADAASAAASAPHGNATLAAKVDRQLRQEDVPSARRDPDGSLAARADADLAVRAADDKRPRLQVQRQNLKGADAARAIARQTNPNTIDRATAYGDKDHTEQVTDLQVSVKKPGQAGH